MPSDYDKALEAESYCFVRNLQETLVSLLNLFLSKIAPVIWCYAASRNLSLRGKTCLFSRSLYQKEFTNV